MIVLVFFAASSTPQTSHHYFLMNLALSDFVLCLFTMPLNTYRSLYVYTTFPPTFCKLADSFPAINICVSSFTIMTISIYRYLLVCYPHRPPLGKCSTFIIMISIWLLAIGASSPLFIYSRSIPAYEESLLESMLEVVCNYTLNNSCAQTHRKTYQNLRVCHESWPSGGQFRLIYTIFMLFLQFILPILIICLTYYKVMLKLRERKKNVSFCQRYLAWWKTLKFHPKKDLTKVDIPDFVRRRSRTLSFLLWWDIVLHLLIRIDLHPSLSFHQGFRYRFLMKRNNISSLRHEISRQRRNNILLLLIVTVYAISWLPFNISYILFLYMNQSRKSGRNLFISHSNGHSSRFIV